MWNIQTDTEFNAFDFGLKPKVFFDKEGLAYVSEGDRVLLTR